MKETEFVLVTQFGRPLYAIAGAGLHAKWAFQSATYFDRRLRIYNPRPSEFLTRDKKNIVVDSYVAWKIQDPTRFLAERRRPGRRRDAPARHRLVRPLRRARRARSRFARFHRRPHAGDHRHDGQRWRSSPTAPRSRSTAST